MTRKTLKHVVVTPKSGKYVVREVTPERSATKALYVMLTEEQKQRYEAAAAASKMTMREYVVNALDAQVAQQQLEIEHQPDGTSLTTHVVRSVEDPRVSQLLLRVGMLEKTLEALKRRVESEWGPEFPPLHWRDQGSETPER